MSKIEVNAIEPQCGTTLTVGASGDTITFPTGTTVVNNGTQTGFGRNGSVNWQTTIKTVDFTAVSGEGYFVNTTSGIITLTLPASPSVGDIVAFKDYAGTFQTSNLTIDRNGSNIVGGTDNPVISIEGQSVILIYGDATQGWQAVEAATNSDLPRPSFICASVSGACNTLVTAPDCANVKIATFTGPGNFTVNSISDPCAANNIVSHVIVAGGGGGGGGYQSGGGGAGGYREVISPTSPYSGSPLNGYPTAPNIVTVTAQAYPVVIGGGGAGGAAAPAGPNGQKGANGNNSSFGGITSAGGGAGGAFTAPSPTATNLGNPGGSGGGSGRVDEFCQTGGSGNTPPVSPAQGTNGGLTTRPYQAPFNGAGGGGAIGGGGPGQAACFGVGGVGTASSINGTPTSRAGGGGSGGGGPTSTGSPCGTGGDGASAPGSQAAQAGTANTGGGGGGGNIDGGIPTSAGGTGGSGVVIIRYKFQ